MHLVDQAVPAGRAPGTVAPPPGRPSRRWTPRRGPGCTPRRCVPLGLQRLRRGEVPAQGVDDDQVALTEHVGELRERGVDQRPVRPVGRASAPRPGSAHGPPVELKPPVRVDSKTGSPPSRLSATAVIVGRRHVPPAGRQLDTARWDGHRPPGRAVPGTTVAGSGRSEMSSPGKASWCVCVHVARIDATPAGAGSARPAPR